MFEIVCLNCGHREFRMAIDNIVILRCDCGIGLFFSGEKTGNCLVKEKKVFTRHAFKDDREEFREFIKQKYEKQTNNL